MSTNKDTSCMLFWQKRSGGLFLPNIDNYNKNGPPQNDLLAKYFEFNTTSAVRESLFTLYLYSGLRPSVSGKVTSNNGNLRNLSYTKNICHVILASIASESAHSITQVEPLKPRF